VAMSWDKVPVSPDYAVVDAALEDACEDAVRVWERNIGWAGRLPEMYRRFYLDYPLERPILKLLRHFPSQSVVGTLGVGLRRVLWRGREIRAGMLAHFCVMREHRRIKPAVLLIKSLVDACSGRFDVLYAMPGTPNAAALGRLLSFPPSATLTRRVKIVHHAKYAARLLPRPFAALAGGALDGVSWCRERLQSGRGDNALHAEWADRIDPRMEQLWSDSPHGSQWNAVRDTSVLRWRFDLLPSQRRRYLLLAAEPHGPLVAWFACDTNASDPDILAINDFWCVQGTGGINRSVVRQLCHAAGRLGFAAVELRFAASDAVAAPWVREGFIERNRLPVFVFWLNPTIAGDTQDLWHITDFDNDG
jgi:hypothetical protein